MKCPMCKGQGIALPDGHTFKCSRCGGLFDNDPDEGGVSGNNPVRAAIGREEFEIRERARKLKRMSGGSNEQTTAQEPSNGKT